MSTEITESTTYGWYCTTCSEGADDYDFESDACVDAADHDTADHPEPDPS